MKKYLFIFSLCISSFASTCFNLSVNLGYRQDRVLQKGAASIITTDTEGASGTITFFDRKLNNLHLLQIETGLFVSVDQVFFSRASIAYGAIASYPNNQFKHTFNNAQVQAGVVELQSRKYSLDALIAAGIQIYMSSVAWICPEIGVAFNRLKLNSGNDVQMLMPFIGVQFLCNLGDYFYVNPYFDYFLLGRRHEHIQLFNGQTLPKITNGDSYGSQLGFILGYRLNACVALNLDAFYRYLTTSSPTQVFADNQFLDLKTKWSCFKIAAGITFGF
jgi:hypothetical protein